MRKSIGTNLAILAALVLGLVAIPPTVMADQYVLIVGEDAPQSGGVFSSLNSGDMVTVALHKDHCYCCTILSKDLTDFPYFESVKDKNLATVSTKKRGSVEPAVPVHESHPFPGKTRVCFTAQSTGRFHLMPQFATSPADNVQISCEETTLYGNYNLNGSDEQTLELTNRLNNASVDVTVLAKSEDADGDEVLDVTKTVNAGRQKEIDLVESITTRSQGSIMACHNGPPGALTAVISYNNVTTAPEYQTVTREELKARGK